MNREMLKEAIAEAKTIKEIAIANAKAALEEAFTPQLTAMFAERLNEDEDEEQNENYGMEEEGLEEGIQKGREEGREEGRLLTLREAVEQVLRSRFKKVAPEISRKLASTTSTKQLTEFLTRAATIKRPRDLLSP